MRETKTLITAGVVVALLVGSATPTSGSDSPVKHNRATIRLSEFDDGIVLTSATDPDMMMYYWIFEGVQFDAMERSEEVTTYTPGRGKRRLGHWRAMVREHRKIEIAPDGGKAIVKIQNAKDPAIDMVWTFTAVGDGAEVELKVKNVSNYDWPEVASFHPCFHPGVFSAGYEKLVAEGKLERKVQPNCEFANRSTYFLTKDGLTLLEGGHRHANSALEKQIAALLEAKTLTKPVAAPPATDGLLVRVSNDDKWVAGVAWNDFLFLSAHHPYRCMHTYVRLGALKQEETRTLKGRLYLFPGTKEECVKRYRCEFRPNESNQEKELSR